MRIEQRRQVGGLSNEMSDWEKLLLSGPDRSLEGLEQDIRRRIDQRQAEDLRSAALASVQAGLAILSICGGLVWGGLAAGSKVAASPTLEAFSPRAPLAPSSNLSELGH